MSKHMTEWLSAYLDAELRGSRLHDVQTHLAECQACRSELQALESLSSLLQEVPVPEFTLPERFAARVSLRLPHQQKLTSTNKIFEIGWWMIPIGLLAVWIFINTSFLVSDMLSVANNFGLLTSVSDWIRFGTSHAAGWSATLGQFGVLSGDSLNLATSTETFTRTTLPQISLQISIALLYLSWIAIWWAHYRRRGPGQPLEG